MKFLTDNYWVARALGFDKIIAPLGLENTRLNLELERVREKLLEANASRKALRRELDQRDKDVARVKVDHVSLIKEKIQLKDRIKDLEKEYRDMIMGLHDLVNGECAGGCGDECMESEDEHSIHWEDSQ